jgi:chemotaxis protein CheX
MTMTLTNETFSIYKDCLQQAAGDVIRSACGVQIQPTDHGEDLASAEVIIGIISLVGDAELSVFIGLPRTTAAAMAAKFAGFEIPVESPDMGDAVGEMANLLAGATKNLLDARGMRVSISLPTVIRAQSIHVLTQRHALNAKTGFQTDLGPFWAGLSANEAGVVGV